jgi:hypothetical protein
MQKHAKSNLQLAAVLGLVTMLSKKYIFNRWNCGGNNYNCPGQLVISEKYLQLKPVKP